MKQILFSFFIFTKMMEIRTSSNQDVKFILRKFCEQQLAYEKNYLFFLLYSI